MSPYLVCCLFEREEYLFIEIRQFRHRWRKDYCRIHSRYWFGLNGDPFLFSVLSISVRNMLLAFCHRVFPSALLVRSKILVLFGLSLVNNVTKHLGFGLGLFFFNMSCRCTALGFSTCSRTKANEDPRDLRGPFFRGELFEKWSAEHFGVRGA